MEKRTQPLVSKETIYICLVLVGFIMVLLVLGSIEWGFVETIRLVIGGLRLLI